MAYVTDDNIVEEASLTPAQTERKKSGRARGASVKKTGGSKKSIAPAAPSEQLETAGHTEPQSGAEHENAPDAPPPTDAAAIVVVAEASSGEGEPPVQSARPGRQRSAAGKNASATEKKGRGTGTKSPSRLKKSAASDTDNASSDAVVGLPAAAAKLSPLATVDEMPPPRDAAGASSLPDAAASAPGQPEANLAGASAPRRKTRSTGRVKRTTAKESAPPPTAAAEPLAVPVAAETTSYGQVPPPFAAAPPASLPSAAETSSEAGISGRPDPDGIAAETSSEADISGRPDPDGIAADAEPSADGAPDGEISARDAVGTGLTGTDLPISRALDPAPLVEDSVDAALFSGGATVAEPVDEENKDVVETATETTGEAGRKRRRSRRGGRGRRKGSRAASAVNGAESFPGEAPATPAGTDAGPALSTSPAAQTGAEADEEDARDDADVEAPQTAGAKGKARRKMFVSVLPGEQVEVVITEEGQVQEYYVEMLHQAKTKGNIYKGVVHNIDPNLQAAFIGYGAARNGFLQIDEIHPEYYVSPHDGSRGRKYPLIQKILKPGQEVLVQVVKEPAGSKGAFLTTYLAIPGRFLVLTPGREQVGVSRKVEDDGERARLRELLEGLNPGPGLGVIVRTVSMGAGKTNLQRDLQFLKRTWKEVRARGTSETSPCIVYQEMDLTARAVRDYLNESIEEVHIDDEETAATVTEVAEALFPRRKNLVRVYKDPGMGLFERFNIQRQLDQIHSREVTLPSGGRLVIDAAEALTAIDINSGRSGGKNNFEDLAYRTNMEAAAMIPLQLRLRDIGGQIVADFIEMRDRSHWREVEKTLRNGMKADRARYDVGKVSAFGLLEMVRQRLGSSAISVSTEPCPFCRGTGVRRNMEWRCQHALRDIRNLMRNAQSKNSDATEYNTEPELALHLLNRKRKLLTDLEQLYGVGLTITMRASEPGI
jgi:ribonuclease E